jgi:hypothetical protein
MVKSIYGINEGGEQRFRGECGHTPLIDLKKEKRASSPLLQFKGGGWAGGGRS